MNIFYLDLDPVLCAQYHADKHVVKMILEYTQILSTVHHLFPSEQTNINQLLKSSHINHPCNKWARENSQNYCWLTMLLNALCIEYTFRYNKQHKLEKMSNYLYYNYPSLPFAPMTLVYLAMPDDCKIEKDTVNSYRKYYTDYKRHLAKWTKREHPWWYK